jgi:type I restriction enzyme, S subunit
MQLTEKQKSAGWHIVKFGDMAQEVKSNTKDPLSEGIERYIGLEHIDPESLRLARYGVIAEDNPTFTKKFSVGDILFGRRRAYLKKAAIADFDGICSGDITVIAPKGDELVPDLLPFIVQSEPFFDWAVKHSAGGLSPRTKFKSLAEFEFPLPPRTRQEEIFGVIKKIYDLSNQTHDTYLDSLSFLQRVIDKFVNNDRKDNPKENWKRIMLKNLADANISSLKGDTEPDYAFDYIDISSVEYPGNLLSPEKKLFKDAPSRAKRVIKENDVLISTVRPNHRATLLIDPLKSLDHIASTGFCVLTPKSGVSGEWLFYSTISKSFTHSMKNLMVGTSFPAVSDDDILVQKIDYPENPEILDKHLIPIRSVYEITQQLIAKYNKLKILQKQAFQSYLQLNEGAA